MPRVSIVMTIYNAGPFLQPALDSLAAQTFRDFELIAVENGSSDGSRDVIRASAANDARIRVKELPNNIGRVPALNLALDEARGDYVAILDADDIAHPDRLAAQVALLDAQPGVTMVSSHARTIDEQGRALNIWAPACDASSLYDALAYENPFSHSACTFRRQPALAAGGYASRYPIANDFALWIALAQRGELAMIDRPLADIRIHQANTTNAAPYAESRFYEELELYRLAQALPGISARARRLGRATIARLHFNLAKRMLRTHRPLRAGAELLLSVLNAPLFFLRQSAARLAGSR